jgi:hypothetical protein
MKDDVRDDGEWDDYEVGYGRPPKNGQFKKGISGNPFGRPKRASNFEAIVLRELNSHLTINENGKRKVITKDEGIVKQLVNKALKGHVPSMRQADNWRRQALEKAAEEERLANRSVKEFSTAELTAILRAELRKNSGKDGKMGSDVIEPLPSTEV